MSCTRKSFFLPLFISVLFPLLVCRGITLDPSFVCRADVHQRRRKAHRAGWPRNDAWFRAVYSYRDHEHRAAWVLLNFKSRYHSFIKRKTGQPRIRGGRQVHAEEEGGEPVQSPTNVEHRAASGAEATSSGSDSKVAEFAEANTIAVRAETSSRLRGSHQVAHSSSTSSSSEEGEDMQRCRPTVVVQDLGALALGG